jgi:hypothetical protein
MIGFFGLGIQEIVILAALALVPIGVAIVLVITRASSGSSSRLPELEDENRTKDRTE